MSDDDGFAGTYPLAWTFHRNTSRWATNTLDPGESHYQSAPREYLSAPFLSLPEPLSVSSPFQELVEGRVSCRRFREGAEVPLVHLSTLLHLAYGVLGRSAFGSLEFLDRPVPSAGGLYPLELYLLIRSVEGVAPGVYHYAVVGHGLEQLREVLVPASLNDYLFMGQHYLTPAGATLVIAAEVDRTMTKYGDRGYRYLLLEAGHCAQNVNLAATGLGLGTCNIGGFFDQELADLLTVDADVVTPLYGIALGVPQDRPADELRGVEARM